MRFMALCALVLWLICFFGSLELSGWRVKCYLKGNGVRG